jgi:hypothetical protein
MQSFRAVRRARIDFVADFFLYRFVSFVHLPKACVPKTCGQLLVRASEEAVDLRPVKRVPFWLLHFDR